MLLERNTAPVSPDAEVPHQDKVKSNDNEAAANCSVHNKENVVQFDMNVLSASCNNVIKKPNRISCCSDATAECSTSSGESFTNSSSTLMSPREGTPSKTVHRQRSILRKESSVSEAQENTTHKKRSVQFGTVLVRDYDMILGDNPSCSYGPPVTIDWDYHEYEPLDLDKYEFEIADSRRSMRQMLLNYYQRMHLLQDYTEDDFKATKKEIKRIKSQRYITKHFLCCYRAEVAVESACRKFKRTVLK